MAGRQPARQRTGVFDTIENWMNQRNADVQRLGRDAEAAAHEALGRAARTGQQFVAMRPGDVVAIGARILNQQKPTPQAGRPAAPTARSKAPTHSNPEPRSRPIVQSAGDQILAGARGAQDAFTFGLGDRLYAGARAIGDAAHGADLGEAYGERMAAEHDRDRYDDKNYAAARTVGKVVGTGAQIAALGPMEGLVLGGARIAQATPLIAREVAVLGGLSGAAGVGGQLVSDVAQRRLGSAGDYLGAGVGGAVAGLASRGGYGGYAGAAGGAATSLAQDLANGRIPSIDKARDTALAGGVFGAAGGMAGRAGADRLSRATKEQIGEDVSRIRTWARGDKTVEGSKIREYLAGGGYTVPDQRTLAGEIVESKFGRSARLSKRQTQAYGQLPNFRVDHSLPKDVGVLLGFPAAQVGMREYD